MRKNLVLPIVLACIGGLVPVGGQVRKHDFVIKGGHVIDPKNGIDGVMDVAIADGKISRADREIPAGDAAVTINAGGLFVTPGLIDLHVHVYYGTEANADYSNGFNALPPDGFTFRTGVTTAVDAGGAGWRNFIHFKEQVIDRSQTRVLAFLNIVGSGMKGGPVEQNVSDMDPRLTAQRARQFRDLIVGVKLAHFDGPDWTPADRAVEAGRLAGIPVMVDFGRSEPPLPLGELLLRRLRPGDILTHTYASVSGRQPLVDAHGRLEVYAREARGRGIIFDVGHGGGSFLFRQAVPATLQGFWPDTISTDLHKGSMNAGMKDLSNVMSKFLNLGMTIQDVVRKSTWEPARVIHRDSLGHLSVGAEADVTVLRLREGQFGFVDTGGTAMKGARKLECEMTIRAGRVVWDLNGLASRDWKSRIQ